MSLYSRRAILTLLAGAPLAACGFQPVFAPGTPASGLRGTVLVDPPGSRAAFDLTRAIESRLGRPETVLYKLSVSQTVSTSSLAIQGSSAVTRYNLTGAASYVLADAATQAVVSSGSVDALTSYSTSASTSSTTAARTAATRRLSEALADQIVNRLLVTVNLTQ